MTAPSYERGTMKFPKKYATHMAHLYRDLVFLGVFRTSAAFSNMPVTTLDFSADRRSSTCFILVYFTEAILFYAWNSSLQPYVKHCTALLNNMVFTSQTHLLLLYLMYNNEKRVWLVKTILLSSVNTQGW